MEERTSRPRPEVGALSEPELDRLRRAINGSTEGLWEWDVPTGMVWYSPRASALLADGPAPSPPTWDAVRARLHPDDSPDFDAALALAADRGELDVSFRLRLAPGDRWFRVRGATPEDGGLAGLILSGSIQDIDEFRHAQDRNAYLAAVVDSLEKAVIGLDLQGTIIAWNAGATHLLGREGDEVLGQPVAGLAPWVRLDLMPDLFPRALRGETVTGQIVEHRREDGERLELALRLAPVRNASGAITGASVVAQDVTARRAMERRLVAAGRDLRRRSDELEQFVYTVSHDLKSPLVTCTGYVGILEEDLKEGDIEAALDSSRRVRNAVTKMGRLIDDLLELSRIGRYEGPPRRLDLPRLLSELAEVMAPRFDELGARLEIAPDLPEAVYADDRELSRALENLLENALKYACDGPDPVVTLGALAEGGETRIFVRDTGPGIAPEYHRKVFGLFQRLDTRKPGTGVGLASVAKVASVLGGRAWLDSEPGRGSTFWIALPDRSSGDGD